MRAIDLLRRAVEAQPGFDPASFDPEALIAGLDKETRDALLERILADEERARFNKFNDLFADESDPAHGIYARHLYPKHLEFFRAGRDYRERCFMAANRVGKTVAGAYETACHLTGRYPHWWEGRRFRRPIRAWVAGDTNETTRDILQLELLGQVSYAGHRKTLDGSGITPRDAIGDVIWKQGVQNLIDTIEIKHVSGSSSQLAFKSYDQGRRAFQGTAKELIWLDEECDEGVYEECLIRTATTRGILMTTFTPLLGMSKVVMGFLPKHMRPSE
jgi:phage terminase large subunit-like protein